MIHLNFLEMPSTTDKPWGLGKKILNYFKENTD